MPNFSMVVHFNIFSDCETPVISTLYFMLALENTYEYLTVTKQLMSCWSNLINKFILYLLYILIISRTSPQYFVKLETRLRTEEKLQLFEHFLLFLAIFERDYQKNTSTFGFHRRKIIMGLEQG